MAQATSPRQAVLELRWHPMRAPAQSRFVLGSDPPVLSGKWGAFTILTMAVSPSDYRYTHASAGKVGACLAPSNGLQIFLSPDIPKY